MVFQIYPLSREGYTEDALRIYDQLPLYTKILHPTIPLAYRAGLLNNAPLLATFPIRINIEGRPENTFMFNPSSPEGMIAIYTDVASVLKVPITKVFIIDSNNRELRGYDAHQLWENRKDLVFTATITDTPHDGFPTVTSSTSSSRPSMTSTASSLSPIDNLAIEIERIVSTVVAGELVMVRKERYRSYQIVKEHLPAQYYPIIQSCGFASVDIFCDWVSHIVQATADAVYRACAAIVTTIRKEVLVAQLAVAIKKYQIANALRRMKEQWEQRCTVFHPCRAQVVIQARDPVIPMETEEDEEEEDEEDEYVAIESTRNPTEAASNPLLYPTPVGAGIFPNPRGFFRNTEIAQIVVVKRSDSTANRNVMPDLTTSALPNDGQVVTVEMGDSVLINWKPFAPESEINTAKKFFRGSTLGRGITSFFGGSSIKDMMPDRHGRTLVCLDMLSKSGRWVNCLAYKVSREHITSPTWGPSFFFPLHGGRYALRFYTMYSKRFFFEGERQFKIKRNFRNFNGGQPDVSLETSVHSVEVAFNELQKAVSNPTPFFNNHVTQVNQHIKIGRAQRTQLEIQHNSSPFFRAPTWDGPPDLKMTYTIVDVQRNALVKQLKPNTVEGTFNAWFFTVIKRAMRLAGYMITYAQIVNSGTPRPEIAIQNFINDNVDYLDWQYIAENVDHLNIEPAISIQSRFSIQRTDAHELAARTTAARNRAIRATHPDSYLLSPAHHHHHEHVKIGEKMAEDTGVEFLQMSIKTNLSSSSSSPSSPIESQLSWDEAAATIVGDPISAEEVEEIGDNLYISPGELESATIKPFPRYESAHTRFQSGPELRPYMPIGGKFGIALTETRSDIAPFELSKIAKKLYRIGRLEDSSIVEAWQGIRCLFAGLVPYDQRATFSVRRFNSATDVHEFIAEVILGEHVIAVGNQMVDQLIAADKSGQLDESICMRIIGVTFYDIKRNTISVATYNMMERHPEPLVYCLPMISSPGVIVALLMASYYLNPTRTVGSVYQNMEALINPDYLRQMMQIGALLLRQPRTPNLVSFNKKVTALVQSVESQQTREHIDTVLSKFPSTEDQMELIIPYAPMSQEKINSIWENGWTAESTDDNMGETARQHDISGHSIGCPYCEKSKHRISCPICEMDKRIYLLGKRGKTLGYADRAAQTNFLNRFKRQEELGIGKLDMKHIFVFIPDTRDGDFKDKDLEYARSHIYSFPCPHGMIFHKDKPITLTSVDKQRTLLASFTRSSPILNAKSLRLQSEKKRYQLIPI